jgi:hypothetical protein
MGLGTNNQCAGEGQQQFVSQLGPSCLRHNKHSAYTERPTPPLIEEEPHF